MEKNQHTKNVKLKGKRLAVILLLLIVALVLLFLYFPRNVIDLLVGDETVNRIDILKVEPRYEVTLNEEQQDELLALFAEHRIGRKLLSVEYINDTSMGYHIFMQGNPTTIYFFAKDILSINGTQYRIYGEGLAEEFLELVQSAQGHSAKAEQETIEEESSPESTTESTQEPEGEMQPEEKPVITPGLEETERWADFLNHQGQLVLDVNEDGIEDTFYIEYVDKEGGWYIAEFAFTLGDGDCFMISEGEQSYEDYSGHLVKIELLDFDGDGAQELILMFDAHGAGGRGLHELYVLWMNADKSMVSSGPMMYVDVTEANGVIPDEETQVDTIYYIQKVMYEGKECLQTRQYVSEGDHSNWVGDLTCIISLEKYGEAFEAQVAWMDLEFAIPDK